MKTRIFLLLTFLISSVICLSCSSDGSDAEQIAEELSNRLTDALDIEGGDYVDKEPPAGKTGEEAPQITAIKMSENVWVGDGLAAEIETDYKKLDDIAKLILHVEKATGYIEVPGAFASNFMTMVGKLKADAELKGKDFKIRFALQSKAGVTGEYKVNPLAIQNSEPPKQQDSLPSMGMDGAIAKDEPAPRGSADENAPQIEKIEAPSEIFNPEQFEIKLYTTFDKEISAAILTLPNSPTHMEIPAKKSGDMVIISGSFLGGALKPGDQLSFLFALKATTGEVGVYRVWEVKVIEKPKDLDGDFEKTPVEDGDDEIEIEVEPEPELEPEPEPEKEPELDEVSDIEVVEDIWTDASTGLIWQNGGFDNKYSWTDAQTFCEDLVWANHTDWRVPGIDELRQIVNGCSKTEFGGDCGVGSECSAQSCWDISCFGCTTARADCLWKDGLYGPCGTDYEYWSSNELTNDTNFAWVVEYEAAAVANQSKTDSKTIRCVHDRVIVDGDIDIEETEDDEEEEAIEDDLETVPSTCVCGEMGVTLTVVSGCDGWPDATECTGWASVLHSVGLSETDCFTSGSSYSNYGCEIKINCPPGNTCTPADGDVEEDSDSETELEVEPEPELEPEPEIEEEEVCNSHAYYKCDDGDIYWYDFCDNREEKKEECGTGSCFGATCGGELPTGYCDSNLCAPVSPTSQDKCYTWSTPWEETSCPGGIPASCGNPATDGCGQDAQYVDNARTFTCYDVVGTETPCADLPTASEDEVVTDSLSSLMWQRKRLDTYTGCSVGYPDPNTDCTWQEAVDYCANLTYGGYSDWRLPNPHELLSLIDNGTDDPSVDPDAFPDTLSDLFRSSSLRSSNTSYAWYVSFDNGKVYYSGKDDPFYNVRCVRLGQEDSGTGSFDHFVTFGESGSEIVLDSVTELIWQKSYMTGRNWEGALSYCEDLDYGGFSDWRLPNKNELTSLIDYNSNGPASGFPDMPSSYFWSSSTYTSKTSFAWGMYFDNGEVNGYGKNTYYSVRCVRSKSSISIDVDGDVDEEIDSEPEVEEECIPETCSSLGVSCGVHDDGCGGQVNCGVCTPDGDTVEIEEDGTPYVDPGYSGCYCPWKGDDFEDGNLDGWTLAEPTRYSAIINSSTAANGTYSSFHLQKNNTTAHGDGMEYSFTDCIPDEISFWVMVPACPSDGQGCNHLRPVDATNGKEPIWFMADNPTSPTGDNGFWSLASKGTMYPLVECKPYEWIHVQLMLTYAPTYTVDAYVNGVLRQSSVPFYEWTDFFNKIELYHWSTGWQGYYDEIEFRKSCVDGDVDVEDDLDQVAEQEEETPDPPYTVWSESYGDTDSNQFGKGVAVASDGSSYVFGDYRGTLDFGGSKQITSLGLQDVFLAHINEDGSTDWVKSFGDASNDNAVAIDLDSSDNIVIVGNFQGDINLGGSTLTSTIGDNDIYIAKFSSAGTHVWSNSFGDGNQDNVTDIKIDAAGGWNIAGNFKGSINFGGDQLDSLGGNDMFVAKFLSSGAHHWSDSYGSAAVYESIEAIALKDDSYLYVTGYFTGTVNFGGNDLTSAGKYDVFVAKISGTNGAHKWSYRYGDAEDQTPSDITIDNSENVYVTGGFQSSITFDKTLNSSSASDNDIFLAKIDINGNHIWSHDFGNASSQSGRLVEVDSDGNIICAGKFAGTVNFGGNDFTSPGGSGDIYIAKFNASGVHQWSKAYGNTSANEPTAIDIYGNSSFYMTGIFESNIYFENMTPLSSAGGRDIFLVKIGY